jgi:hypothetical protein
MADRRAGKKLKRLRNPEAVAGVGTGKKTIMDWMHVLADATAPRTRNCQPGTKPQP